MEDHVLHQLLNLAGNHAKVAAWEIDFGTHRYAATDAFFHIMGMAPNEGENRLIQLYRRIVVLFNQEQRFSLREAVRHTQNTRESFTLTLNVTIGEAVKWLRVTTKDGVQDDDIIRGTLQDVTGDRANEVKQQFLKWSNDKSGEMIVWVRPDAGIAYANELVTDRLFYTPKELKKLKLFDLSPAFLQKTWQATWHQIVQGRFPMKESLLLAKNGSLVPVEMQPEYVRFYGKEYFFLYFKDISKWKNQERELTKANSLIETMRSEMETVEAYAPATNGVEKVFDEIITRNTPFLQLLEKAEEVAHTDTTVLILGETGTGKELLARGIHRLSPRKDKPFVIVNCAAIPPSLIESELFGYERGAFTGADRRKTGRFEEADKGTIFLDEIGELPLDMQSKLLRVLQEGTFERIGSNKSTRVDLRILAATNQQLAFLVDSGGFRRDLYYRLNVFPILIPPLRERKDDISLLVRHFVKKYNDKLGRNVHSIPQSALNKFRDYNFPGNVRELENLIEKSIILSKGERLEIEESFPTLEVITATSHFKTFEEMQRDYILKALFLTNWRISGPNGAAQLLDLNPKTLETKMRKLKIKRPSYK